MDRDTLADRLARVRRRIESDVPYSPDWAAAMEELEELEAALVAKHPVPRTDDRVAPPRAEAPAT